MRLALPGGKASKKKLIPVILPSGEHEKDADGKEKQIEIVDFGDSGIYLRGSSKSQINIWSWPIGSGEVYGYRMDKSLPPEIRAGVTPKVKADAEPEQWNRMFITMVGDRLSVKLNGTTVIENAAASGDSDSRSDRPSRSWRSGRVREPVHSGIKIECFAQLLQVRKARCERLSMPMTQEDGTWPS